LQNLIGGTKFMALSLMPGITRSPHSDTKDTTAQCWSILAIA